MIRIIADDAIPFLKGALEPYAQIRYLPWHGITHEQVSGADALLVRTRTHCDEKLLRDTGVRFIGTVTIGFDHIDTRFCDAAGICWANAPGCNAGSVLQYVASALCTLETERGFDPVGKTLGIVGAGHIGSKVEKLARLIGMKVLVNDPPRERSEGPGNFVPLETLLQASDIVTLHVPLNTDGPDQTLHLLGDRTIGMMRHGSWLINTSRGGVVKTGALKEALAGGWLSDAILDVWENEPMPERTLVDAVFLATPHIAGYSLDGKANGTAMIVRALAGHFGLPLANWFPEDVPEILNDPVTIDGRGRRVPEIIREAVLMSYDIRKDDSRFRHDPGSFEQQRINYPVRREFPAYMINLVNSTSEALSMLNATGFKTSKPR